ncbi:MAG: AMIN domain-containing protein [Thermodesulfobacteriota bacterium]
MAFLSRAILLTLLGAILFTALSGIHCATAANAVTEVSVTPDLKRVIVKCSQEVQQYNSFRLDRPPRLVIDVTGARPDPGLKPIPPAHNGGLKVQVAESPTGAHVVLDFGGAAVPNMRIKRMGTYLIAFLDEWTPPKKQPPASAVTERKPSPKQTASSSHPVTTKAPPEPRTARSDLIIESARVIDGLIVLAVADRSHPERKYRIDLGVSFEQMGFVSAGIYPLQGTPGGTLARNSRFPTPIDATSGRGKIGPRKQAALESIGRSPSDNGSMKSRESAQIPNKAAYGPRRTPPAERAQGPVSMRLKNDSEWTVQKPRHASATESAWAKLFAYRRAPLVREEKCGFVP